MSVLIPLGLSAIGAVLAARRSRNRYLRDRESTPSPVPLPSDPASSSGQAPRCERVGDAVGETLESCSMSRASPRSGLSSSPVALLLHAFASLLVILLLPDLWTMVVGIVLLMLLAVHVTWAIVSRSPRRVLRTAAGGGQESNAVERQTRHRPLSTDLMESIRALNGLWMKDKGLSDDMTPVCDLMQLSGMLRMAIGLIRGVEITAVPPLREEAKDQSMGATTKERGILENEDGLYAFAVLSGILWFKIREKYALDGVTEARHKRRDFRRGGAIGTASVSKKGGVEIRTRFGPPLEGTMRERIFSPEEGVLHIDTTVTLNGKGSVSYRQVYRKVDR